MRLTREVFNRTAILAALVLVPVYQTWCQGTNGGIYIDPNRSDPKERRSVILSGNRIEMYVTNYGWLGHCAFAEGAGGGVWPRGTDHDHLHSMSPFMAAAVTDINGNPVKVISEGYYIQEKRDPITKIDQKFQPIPGYHNPRQGQSELANQLNPDSWPSSWPGKDSRWSGYWNGYFGLNQKNADQEAYYVMDDAWNNKIPYYPSATDSTLRGLGLQIEVREFQWSHPLAQDVMFAHYQVSNIGTKDYLASSDTLYFGGYADINPNGCGSTADDDADFDAATNMVYAWSNSGISQVWTKFREVPPGYMAWKFLESPGISDDGVDNDNDGMTDERRDNDAGTRLNSSGEVIAYIQANYDVAKFLNYSNYRRIEDVPAVQQGFGWTGDENLDWRGYADLNRNGAWDAGEPLNDDKGTDGIGPDEEGYPGPDPDGTEANGRPEQGEPYFGKTDKDESDQVGLASFSAPLYGTAPITDELNFWPRIRRGYFVRPPQVANQYWVFSVGPFNLRVQKTERFSTCILFAFDKGGIFRAAAVAQRIYDADYQFAKPPKQPKLKAIAGDRRVTLIWDANSEYSRDPIYHADFEGYKVYKSTEPQFLEPTIITDGYGNKVFKAPAAQFDLIDSLTGMHPLQLGEEVGEPQGVHYFMGTDNGLEHSWIDTNVINGRTYYYAVVGYDRGYAAGFYERGLSDNPNLLPITPSECPASITESGGVITRMDPNTAMATPNTVPTNYTRGTSDGDTALAHTAGFANGRITTTMLAPELLKTRKFIVTFTDTLSNMVDRTAPQVEIRTRTYSIYDSTGHVFARQNIALPRTPAGDSVVGGFKAWKDELFDYGVTVNFTNLVAKEDYTKSHSGWEQTPVTNSQVAVALVANYAPLYPRAINIEFGDTTEILDTAYTAYNSLNPNFRRPVNFRATDAGTGQKVRLVIEENASQRNGRIDPGEALVVPVGKTGTYVLTATWRIRFNEPADTTAPWIPPQKGERYLLRPAVPFSHNDSYEFSTTESVVRTRESASLLDKIAVVPNPYIEAAIWEQQPFLKGRGERKLYFMNLPTECTIRIYSLNGYLLRTLVHAGSGGAGGSERWDLTTSDGLEVASGLYVYHVDAPGIGTKVGKFAIVN